MTVWRYCRVPGYNSTHSRMRSSFAWTSVQRLSSKRVRQIEIREPQRHRPVSRMVVISEIPLIRKSDGVYLDLDPIRSDWKRRSGKQSSTKSNIKNRQVCLSVRGINVLISVKSPYESSYRPVASGSELYAKPGRTKDQHGIKQSTSKRSGWALNCKKQWAGNTSQWLPIWALNHFKSSIKSFGTTQAIVQLQPSPYRFQILVSTYLCLRFTLKLLQVAVRFLVRVIPQSRGGQAGYIINVIMALSDITTRIQVVGTGG